MCSLLPLPSCSCASFRKLSAVHATYDYTFNCFTTSVAAASATSLYTSQYSICLVIFFSPSVHILIHAGHRPTREFCAAHRARRIPRKSHLSPLRERERGRERKVFSYECRIEKYISHQVRSGDPEPRANFRLNLQSSSIMKFNFPHTTTTWKTWLLQE